MIGIINVYDACFLRETLKEKMTFNWDPKTKYMCITLCVCCLTPVHVRVHTQLCVPF